MLTIILPPNSRFGPKYFDHVLISLQIRPFNQINTIRIAGKTASRNREWPLAYLASSQSRCYSDTGCLPGKIAVGTYCRLTRRICSPNPGIIFWQTCSVASGITSRTAGPVPPVNNQTTTFFIRHFYHFSSLCLGCPMALGLLLPLTAPTVYSTPVAVCLF